MEKQAFKVIHVRALPEETQDQELIALVAPARVVRTLILQDKRQAFMQMESLEAAQSVVDAFEQNPPKIRDKTVYLQFSNRNEIEGGTEPGSGAASTIIIIAISEVTVPVTLDNIYQITKPLGDVQRIITFTKEANFQALVQFATPQQAQDARVYLDGKDLFQGCCHLRVSFSNRQTLVVRQNDHKSRDYTLATAHNNNIAGPLIPPPMIMNPQHPVNIHVPHSTPTHPSHLVPINHPDDSRVTVLIVNKLDEAKTTCDLLFTLFGVYGDVIRVKIMFNKRGTAFVQMATGQQAESARQNLHGCPLFGQNLQVATSKHQAIQLPRESDTNQDLTRDYTNHPHHRFAKKSFINPKNINLPSAVVHVANIHDSVTAEELRDLFAHHIMPGVVPVVEFFKSSHAMAYVDCGSVEGGVMALVALHEQPFKAYPLRISFSHKDPASLSPSTSATATAATTGYA